MTMLMIGLSIRPAAVSDDSPGHTLGAGTAAEMPHGRRSRTVGGSNLPIPPRKSARVRRIFPNLSTCPAAGRRGLTKTIGE